MPSFVNYPQRIKTLHEKYKLFADLKKKLQEPYEKELEEYKKLQISRAVTNLYYTGYSVEGYARTIQTRILHSIAAALKWPTNSKSYYRYRVMINRTEHFDLCFNPDSDSGKILICHTAMNDDGSTAIDEREEFSIDDLYNIPQALIDKYGEKANFTGFFKKKGSRKK